MSNNINIEGLLDKMLCVMSGREFCTLMQYACSICGVSARNESKELASGIQALADALTCSPSTIYALMRVAREEDGSSDGGGILRDAIVSRIGRKIVFDVERARELSKAYKNSQ